MAAKLNNDGVMIFMENYIKLYVKDYVSHHFTDPEFRRMLKSDIMVSNYIDVDSFVDEVNRKLKTVGRPA